MSVWSSLTGPFAEITVESGHAVVVFNPPKALLCDSSTYFKAALNNGFAESSLQKINLDYDDPHTFRTYAAWLFEHEIAGEAMLGEPEARLYKLYIFADKRGIQDLANDSVTTIASYWTGTCVDFRVATKYLPEIPSKSGLYNLIMDNMILNIRSLWSDEFWNIMFNIEDYSKEVLADLLKRENLYTEDFGMFDACIQSICRYHVHNNLIEEYQCVRSVNAERHTHGEQRGKREQIKWKWHDFHKAKEE